MTTPLSESDCKINKSFEQIKQKSYFCSMKITFPSPKVFTALSLSTLLSLSPLIARDNLSSDTQTAQTGEITTETLPLATQTHATGEITTETLPQATQTHATGEKVPEILRETLPETIPETIPEAIPEALPTTPLNIRQFGAKPDDGKDDTKALRKAAEYCRQHPGTTLLIPAGKYQLTDPQARQLEADVLAGKLSGDPEKKMFVPYFPYVKGLDFAGSKDITVKAEGAQLECDGWMEPVSITDASGFTLEGLTIDYKVQPHSEGVIVDVEDGWFTVEFDPDREMQQKMPQCRICVWDARSGVVAPKVYSFSKREVLPGNRLRIKGKMDPALKGQRIGMSHTFHFRPAVFIGRSTNTTLKNVTIHSQPGMGVLGWDSRDITIQGIRVIPREGKCFSTNTDATHFAACGGTIKVEGCTFQGQGDDAINVHGYYHDILSRDADGSYLTQLLAPTFTHAQETDVPHVGDTVEVTRISTLEPEIVTVVTAVEWEPQSLQVRVRLQDPLPGNYQDYYLFNASKIPALEFRNNRVLGNFARGVLSKARKVVIEDNYFQGCSGTAIHVGAESNWKEGSFAETALIRGNRIVNCGQSYGMQGDACGIAVIIGAPDTQGTAIHGAVTVENNEIVSDLYPSRFGITVCNTRTLTLKGNRAQGCQNTVQVHDVGQTFFE